MNPQGVLEIAKGGFHMPGFPIGSNDGLGGPVIVIGKENRFPPMLFAPAMESLMINRIGQDRMRIVAFHTRGHPLTNGRSRLGDGLRRPLRQSRDRRLPPSFLHTLLNGLQALLRLA